MTKLADRNCLVLDGGEVKFRLQAERLAAKTPVHVDWIRFTTLCRNQPVISFDPAASVARTLAERMFRTEQKVRDLIFPPKDPFYPAHGGEQLKPYNSKEAILGLLDETPDPDFCPSYQALNLAWRVAVALGPDFHVSPDVGKGHDFYKFRWIITRNDKECAWVGFLVSSDSLRQSAQAKTLHVNVFGAACTFAQVGFNQRLSDIVDELEGVLTRCDLALDFFDGYPGGIQAIADDYKQGRCNVNGRKPTSDVMGDWLNDELGNKGRSIYWGSRQAGKITNCYEKGRQLFGPDANSSWLRAELRYGNKLRVLPSDMLRRPADFFAGASDWHTSALALADTCVAPEPVPTVPRLALDTVEAECYKNLKWFVSTGAPTAWALFTHLGDDFIETFAHKALPGRLKNFASSELARAFTAAMGRFTAFAQLEGDSPPFAPA
ncbi:MAG: replication initiation factor domain-containing protein [Polaromonas sp.]|nr:replication initiation factor domain-containing protein [Polaromonas sp.]